MFARYIITSVYGVQSQATVALLANSTGLRQVVAIC